MAYLQMSKADEGRRELQKALSLKPDFEGAAGARKALATIGG